MSVERLFEILPEPAAAIGRDLLVATQNRASRDAYGDPGGRTCYETFFGRTEPCRGCAVQDVFARGRSERWHLLQGGAAGDPGTTYLEVTAIPITGPSGAVTGVVEILRDVTTTLGVEHLLMRDAEQLTARVDELRSQLRELQEAQAVVLQTEKMASLGGLAAGIAHEIHTPLAAIVANIDILKSRLSALDRALGDLGSGAEHKVFDALRGEIPVLREMLGLHELAAERIKLLVRSLRLFAHLDGAASERIDPHEGIEAALALLSHETRGRIEVVRDFGVLPPVLCRPDAMNQVYMNILLNAVQAIEGKGTIRIETHAEPGRQVSIAFHDSGRGIPPEVLGRVFEAGFTTRGRGIGTGLGLAIVYRTVNEHGGQVDVQSEVGRGSVFTVRLPIH